MKKNAILSKQKGFSIIEAMVAVGLLGLLATSMATIVSFSSQQVQTARKVANEDKVVQAIIDQIRADPNKFQKNFTPNTILTQDMLAGGTLPLVWSNEFFGDPAGCPTCVGKAGFVMRPTLGEPGLFEVTVWISNPVMFQDTKSYLFAVTAR